MRTRQRLQLGLPKHLLLVLQLLNQFGHAIRMQGERHRLVGKSGHEVLQTCTAALGKISTASDVRKPLSDERADLVRKRGHNLQACSCNAVSYTHLTLPT